MDASLTRPDWPIRKKLTAILLTIAAMVLLLTSAAFITSEILTFRAMTRSNLATLGRVLAANSTAALAFANEPDAREILGALKFEPHVVAAALYDARGTLFASYVTAAAASGTPPPRPIVDGYRFEGRHLVGAEPVAEAGGARLGTLALYSDTGVIAEALRISGAIAAGVALLALLTAWVLGGKLQQRISGPILSLAATATAVADRHDYSVRAPEAGRDELGLLTGAFNHMLGRIQDQESALQRYATQLEERVAERTRELEARNADLVAANAELDAFAYSVSHDLRAPLRSIDGFSQVLLEDYGAKLDEAGHESLRRVRAASQRMGHLIDDLLKLARLTRSEIRAEPVDLSAVAEAVVADLRVGAPDRHVEVVIAPGATAVGDARLLRILLDNLLSNAWKYTSRRADARIEFGKQDRNGQKAYYVRDNGAGFDMRYADKLFGLFQRLHTSSEFEGLGIGLATARRIVNRHGGQIWADAVVGGGATFFFTL